MKTKFKKGTSVIVSKSHYNASQFNTGKMSCIGVYSVENWENTVFEIAGEGIPYESQFEEDIKYVYPLRLNGVVLGHVYDTAITLATSEDKIKFAAHDLLEALMSIENDDNSIPKAIWDLRNAAIKKALG